jgi:GntR family transcriptional regulator
MEPIFKRVKKDIIEKVSTKEYKLGDKIPSERELVALYKVSRMTIRHAIDELVSEGYLLREVGRGTYVKANELKQKNVKSFTETLKEQGYMPSTQIVEFSTVHHLHEICKEMDTKIEDKYYKIKRLRLGNELPLALETVYMPVSKCKGLEQHEVKESLYTILEDFYGYEIGKLSYDIDACIANKMMQKYFLVNKPIALLKVKGISYTAEGEKLFYEESYYRSDLYKYKVDIYKRK